MRLIDADALEMFLVNEKNFYSDMYNAPNQDETDKKIMGAYYAVLANTCRVVREQPTIDAVKIVRCGECKWFDRLEKNHPYGYCHAAKHGHMTSRWEISIYRKCKEDFYCADGERKEGEHEQWIHHKS